MSRIRTPPDERLHTYILANEPPEHEELRNLRDLTQALPYAHMQILPEQGHFLAFLVKVIDARQVLEIGTFTGYSAMALALALPPDGQIVTCDLNEAMVTVGRPCWERAGVANKIAVMIGPALTTLAHLTNERTGGFDLAFIDADKLEYDRYTNSPFAWCGPAVWLCSIICFSAARSRIPTTTSRERYRCARSMLR